MPLWWHKTKVPAAIAGTFKAWASSPDNNVYELQIPILYCVGSQIRHIGLPDNKKG